MTESAKFLWVGSPIGWLQKLSIKSASANNFSVELYTDAPKNNNMEDVAVYDYREIVSDIDPHELKRRGIPYAAFADVFRYKLLSESDGWWFDTDTLIIRSADEFRRLRGGHENLLGIQPNGQIANGVIFSENQPRMRRLLDMASPSLTGATYRWGMAGPLLVSKVAPEWNNTKLVEPSVFYGLPFDQFIRAWSDDVQDFQTRFANDSFALSFWGKAIYKSGLNFVNPHPDSFLTNMMEKYNVSFVPDWEGLLGFLRQKAESKTRKSGPRQWCRKGLARILSKARAS